MRKILTALCALCAVMGLGTAAFAEPAEEAVNLARGENVTYIASHTDAEGGVELAFDGDMTSRYRDVRGLEFVAGQPYGVDVYVGVVFSELTSVTDINIIWQASRAVQSAEGYWIEITTDGTTWTKAEDASYTYDTTAAMSNDHYKDVITLAEAAEVKGVRVFIKQGTDQWAPSIWEFEVYDNSEPEKEPEDPEIPQTGVGVSTAALVMMGGSAAGLLATRKRKA